MKMSIITPWSAQFEPNIGADLPRRPYGPRALGRTIRWALIAGAVAPALPAPAQTINCPITNAVAF